MAKKAAAVEKVDPTLPFTEVEILGEKYKLCVTFRALAKAEARLRAQGVATNMLDGRMEMTFENIPIYLAAALGTFHPDLTFEQVVGMLDIDTVFGVRNALVWAFADAWPKRDESKGGKKQNPPEPVPTQDGPAPGNN